jgi:hypothetical protein
MQAALTSLPTRLLVTAVTLTVVAIAIDWSQVEERLSRGEWQWFAGGVGLLALACVLAAVRWHLLLRAADVPTTPRRTLILYFFGTFANNLLPTSFGGDAMRAVAAGGSGAMARAAATVTVDRLTAVACLFPIASAALLVDPDPVPAELASLFLISTAGCAVIGGAALSSLRSRRLGGLVPRRAQDAAREIRDTVLGYLRNARLLIALAILGVAYQLLALVTTIWLARSIGLDLPFSLAAVVIPLVLLATLFPISLAGFGIREGSFVVLLGTAGVDAAPAAVLSLLSVAALALASLPGIVVLLSPTRRRGRESKLTAGV